MNPLDIAALLIIAGLIPTAWATYQQVRFARLDPSNWALTSRALVGVGLLTINLLGTVFAVAELSGTRLTAGVVAIMLLIAFLIPPALQINWLVLAGSPPDGDSENPPPQLPEA